jgi:hypothetical protein
VGSRSGGHLCNARPSLSTNALRGDGATVPTEGKAVARREGERVLALNILKTQRKSSREVRGLTMPRATRRGHTSHLQRHLNNNVPKRAGSISHAVFHDARVDDHVIDAARAPRVIGLLLVWTDGNGHIDALFFGFAVLRQVFYFREGSNVLTAADIDEDLPPYVKRVVRNRRRRLHARWPSENGGLDDKARLRRDSYASIVDACDAAHCSKTRQHL